MLRGRLTQLGQPEGVDQVVQGSALRSRGPDAHFGALVSIGCCHHTGDLAGCIERGPSGLGAGGLAMIMVYNRNSLRQLLVCPPAPRWRACAAKLGGDVAARAAYDANAAGEPRAVHRVHLHARRPGACSPVSRSVSIVRENMDPIPRLRLSREQLLGWPARLLGLDLYVTAVK